MANTPEAEANAILNDAWRWLRDNADSDDDEGKRQQVRMILAVSLGLCRPFVSDDHLRDALRDLADDVALWERIGQLPK